MRRSLAPCLLALPLLASCQKTTAPAPEAPADAAAAPAPHSPNVDEAWVFEFTARMQEHDDRARSARDAVVSGDLRAMRESVGWLADHAESEAMPEIWIPFIDQMRRAAHETLVTRDVGDAAVKLGTLGRTCGDCHAAMEKPLSTVAAPPADESGGHAAKASWAFEQMWAGVVYDNEASWNQGAAALALAPMGHVPADLSEETVGHANEQARRILDVANRGGELTDRASRSEAMGQVIAACAECHVSTRGI